MLSVHENNHPKNKVEFFNTKYIFSDFGYYYFPFLLFSYLSFLRM